MTDYPNNISAKLEIIKASEITPKEVRWLWHPYIPFGKVTLLQGDPGDGKSKLMLSLAALLSKGAPLPFAEEDESCEPMTVIYQTTEDDADDTVVPRFNSAGGDGDRLIFIKEDEKSLTFGDDRMHDWIDTQFTVSSGTLPEGITLNSNTGELYGVPKVPDGEEEVKYTFTVEANYIVDGHDNYFEPSSKEYTLTVKPNTDENVYLATDINDGYQIKEHIGTQIGDYSFELTEITDTVFTSNGEYGEFVGLWLNGEKLQEGIDYDSESGSTKITIKSQTFENKTTPDASNTIAMEFRKDTNGDGKGDDGAEMNRTAQNFTVKKNNNVDNVIKLIANLPSNITLNDKGSVLSARSAYDALTSSEKTKVTNYNKLTAAENRIKELETIAGEQALINNVISLINKIPTNVTLNDKQTIQNARSAYNSLTSVNKAKVTNYNKLTAAENRIKELEQIAADKAAANNVIGLIRAIPSTVRLSDKETIEKARQAYDRLSASQKSYVTNHERLVSAENAIKQLEEEQEQVARDKLEAGKVVNLISALPSNITLNDKSSVTNARSAYEKLTSSQKSYVSNYERLVRAESAINQLEAEQEQIAKDKKAADTVINLINSIPSNLSLEDKNTVLNARNAYNVLTSSQKNYVSNYDKLQRAERDIAALEADAKEQAKVNEVISLIDAIPDELSLNDKTTIEEARQAYENLTSEQQKKVINYPDLVNAEATISALEAQDNANKADLAAAQRVSDLIRAIPEDVSIDDKSIVIEARNAYDALTNTQKGLVDNYTALVNAEDRIKSIEDYEAAESQDQEAAKTVIDLIDALPRNIQLTDKEKVEEARRAYDSLTEKQKAIVTNYELLTAAEVEIAKLEKDAFDDIESVTFIGILVDETGKPISDATIEIHSKVQTAVTDKNGSFRFLGVEIGEHSISLKDKGGNVIASTEFSISIGSDLSINESLITAEDGSTFTVSIKKSNDKLVFTNIEPGDKAPVLNPDDNEADDNGSIDIGDDKPDKKPEQNNDKEEGIYIGEDTTGTDKDRPVPSIPNTGVETHITFWVALLICSVIGLLVTTVPQFNKKRIKMK